ncbi:unnamed protein product [Sphacelaria rigidula]
MTGHALLRATMSLTTVGALLSTPPPSRTPLAPTPKRNTGIHQRGVSSSFRLSGSGDARVSSVSSGMFDAGAWKNIPKFNHDLAPSGEDDAHQSPAPSGEGGAHEDPAPSGESSAHIDIDVHHLPTFVFFSEGGQRREDIIGDSNARACWAKLENKLLSFCSPHTVGTRTAVKLTPGAADGVRSPEAGNNGVVIASDASIDDNIGIPSVDDRRENHHVSNNGNIPSITSRDELLRIVTSGTTGGTTTVADQDSAVVVVMYHAPWCRKCAYLTPIFRRLAKKHAGTGSAAPPSFAAKGSEDVLSWTKRLFFCRVDVSALGSKGYDHPRTTDDRDREHSPVGEFQGNIGSGASHKSGDITAATSMNEGGISDFTRLREGSEDDVKILHEGSALMRGCQECGGTGFVPCGECEGRGAVGRSSPDGKQKLTITCPACVGYKRLRCPACGGQCYMC